MIEKLRTENTILKEAKTPIEDFDKYNKEMEELLSRIAQLEKDKEELQRENELLSEILEAKEQ